MGKKGYLSNFECGTICSVTGIFMHNHF